MPTDRDLFSEEQTMVSMSFGDHMEELRARLIMALLGLMVGVVVTFIPPLNLGQRILKKMQEPAQAALNDFYNDRAKTRSEQARAKAAVTPKVEAIIPAENFIAELRKLAPNLDLPRAEELKNRVVKFPFQYDESELIMVIPGVTEPRNALVSLAPLETMTIFFMVCVV